MSQVKTDALEDWRGMDDQKKAKVAKKKKSTISKTSKTKITPTDENDSPEIEETEDIEEEVGNKQHEKLLRKLDWIGWILFV